MEGFLLAQAVKNLPAMQEPDSILGSGRSSREENGYPLSISPGDSMNQRNPGGLQFIE